MPAVIVAGRPVMVIRAATSATPVATNPRLSPPTEAVTVFAPAVVLRVASVDAVPSRPVVASGGTAVAPDDAVNATEAPEIALP